MRILISGGRDYNDYQEFSEVLRDYNPTGICQGGAKGADRLAYLFALGNAIPMTEMKADWKTYGKSAGPRRNQNMLDEFKPDLVLAFPTEKSVGTWDMVRRAKKANVKVVVIGPTKRT